MNAKPTPAPNADSRHFREGCAKEELRFQYCEPCGRAQFPPAPVCRDCGGNAMVWRRSNLRGAIYSLTSVHRAPTPAFRADRPYVLALVDIDEGFRMMMNIVGHDAAEAKIGGRVLVVFIHRTDEFALPQCRLTA